MERFTTSAGWEVVLMGDKVVIKGALKSGPRVLRFKDIVEARGYFNIEKWLWGITKEIGA